MCYMCGWRCDLCWNLNHNFTMGYIFLDTNIADNNSVSVSCGTEVDKNCLVSYYSANSVQNRSLPPSHIHTITLKSKITLFEIDTARNSTQYLWRYVYKGKTQQAFDVLSFSIGNHVINYSFLKWIT